MIEFAMMWFFLVFYTNLKWWYIHRSISHRQFVMHPWLVGLAKLVVYTSQPRRGWLVRFDHLPGPMPGLVSKVVPPS